MGRSFEAWSEEMDAALIRLIEAGRSSGAVARHLAAAFDRDVTRSAVCGRVFRLRRAGRISDCIGGGVWRGQSTRVQSYGSTTRQRRAKPAKPATAQRDAVMSAFEAAPPVSASDDDPPDALISVDDLEPHHCRWVYGDPREAAHVFCGRAKVIGLSYCDRHVRRVYMPRRPEAAEKSEEIEMETAQ